MRPGRSALLAFALAMSAMTTGCMSEPSGTLPTEGQCVVADTTVLELAETSSLGFSAASIVDLARGEHDAQLTYVDGTTASVAITIAYAAGEVRLVQYPHPTGGGAPSCPDELDVDVFASFATSDGKFDEAWGSTVSATALGAAKLEQRIDLDHLVGTYEPYFDADTFDVVRTWVTARFSGAAIAGDIKAQAFVGTNASEHVKGVMEEDYPIATF